MHLINHTTLNSSYINRCVRMLNSSTVKEAKSLIQPINVLLLHVKHSKKIQNIARVKNQKRLKGSKSKF